MEEQKEGQNPPKDSLWRSWLRDRNNQIFLFILFLTVALRIYYFSLTLHQPLWWDEAEYGLRAKSFAFGTPLSGWAPERELIVPLFFALIFKIGLGEISLRFIQFLVSISTVAMTYFTISRITDMKTGLISSFGMSVFWLHIFFSQRILLYLWVPLLYLVIIFLFNEGYLKNKKNYLVATGIFSAVALMTYFSAGFLLFGLFIYLLLVEKTNIIKSKKCWTILIWFVLALLPFLAYFQITYGFPIPRLAVGYTAATSEYGAGIAGLFAYVLMIPSRVGWSFTLLSLVGLILFLFKLALEFGLNAIEKNKNWLLIFICLVIPFSLYTLYGVMGGSATFYDAFILGVFPFLFAFSGYGLTNVYDYFKGLNKTFAILIVIILIGWHGYYGIVNSDFSIKSRLNSYDTVKEGGIWIKQNSISSDVVISQSLPQNTYYSERETIPLPNNESELFKLIEEKKPIYFVDSIWQGVPDWVHELYQNYPDTFEPVQSFKTDGQVSLVVYKINL